MAATMTPANQRAKELLAKVKVTVQAVQTNVAETGSSAVPADVGETLVTAVEEVLSFGRHQGVAVWDWVRQLGDLEEGNSAWAVQNVVGLKSQRVNNPRNRELGRQWIRVSLNTATLTASLQLLHELCFSHVDAFYQPHAIVATRNHYNAFLGIIMPVGGVDLDARREANMVNASAIAASQATLRFSLSVGNALDHALPDIDDGLPKDLPVIHRRASATAVPRKRSVRVRPTPRAAAGGPDTPASQPLPPQTEVSQHDDVAHSSASDSDVEQVRRDLERWRSAHTAEEAAPVPNPLPEDVEAMLAPHIAQKSVVARMLAGDTSVAASADGLEQTARALQAYARHLVSVEKQLDVRGTAGRPGTPLVTPTRAASIPVPGTVDAAAAGADVSDATVAPPTAPPPGERFTILHRPSGARVTVDPATHPPRLVFSRLLHPAAFELTHEGGLVHCGTGCHVGIGRAVDVHPTIVLVDVDDAACAHAANSGACVEYMRAHGREVAWRVEAPGVLVDTADEWIVRPASHGQADLPEGDTLILHPSRIGKDAFAMAFELLDVASPVCGYAPNDVDTPPYEHRDAARRGLSIRPSVAVDPMILLSDLPADAFSPVSPSHRGVELRAAAAAQQFASVGGLDGGGAQGAAGGSSADAPTPAGEKPSSEPASPHNSPQRRALSEPPTSPGGAVVITQHFGEKPASGTQTPVKKRATSEGGSPHTSPKAEPSPATPGTPADDLPLDGAGLRKSFNWATSSNREAYARHRLRLITEVKHKHADYAEKERRIAAQGGRCKGCLTTLKKTYSAVYFSWRYDMVRFCWYMGVYYCNGCHDNTLSIAIPARVLNEWDTTAHPVCHDAYMYLKSLWDRPILCISAVNPLLFQSVTTLLSIREIRMQLCILHGIVDDCPAFDAYLKSRPELITESNLYYLEETELYSLEDVVQCQQHQPVQFQRANSVPPVLAKLEKMRNTIIEHVVRRCPQHCYRKAAKTCEGCSTADESTTVFAFDLHKVHTCTRCQRTYHKSCYQRRACTYCTPGNAAK